MNCPKCMTGILECVGYFEIKEGPVQFHLSRLLPEHTPAIGVNVCSKDHCGHVGFEAAPESLSLARRNFRDMEYAHYMNFSRIATPRP